MRLLSLLLLCVAASCQSAPTPGAVCVRAADCASPLVCHFEHCRAACAADRDCPTPATCLLDDGVGSCALDIDLGCESGIGRTCAAGLVCVADRCAQRCGASMGCATGSICTDVGGGTSICVSSSIDAAIPPTDAGLLDVGLLDAAMPSETPIGTVCIGDGFLCATSAATGQPFCWGRDATTLGYEVGDTGAGCNAARADSDHPLAVPLSDIDELACGRSWVCGHRTDGAVLCWGDSSIGQIDPGTPSLCDRTPHAIDGVDYPSGHGQLVTSTQLACALNADDHAIRCWGGDQGTVMPQSEPITGEIFQPLLHVTPIPDPLVPTGAMPSLVAINDGLYDASDAYGGGCFVEASDGSVWCWGSNAVGQAGGPPGGVVTAARAVSPLAPARAIVRSTGATCALVGDELWCWGVDAHGELTYEPADSLHVTPDCRGGTASTFACSGTPLHYTGVTFSAIASHASAVALCGISSSAGHTGDVYCWGSGEFVQNTHTDHSPVVDPLNGHIQRADLTGPLTSAASLVVAWQNACALDQSGALWCWGLNEGTQLENADTTAVYDRATRVRIP